jgi:hypothetical protein
LLCDKTKDFKINISISKNSNELLGKNEIIIPVKVFNKKENIFKKWVSLNNPSIVKKSKLSLLDQIKINIVVDIHYDTSEFNENIESINTSITKQSEICLSNRPTAMKFFNPPSRNSKELSINNISLNMSINNTLKTKKMI